MKTCRLPVMVKGALAGIVLASLVAAGVHFIGRAPRSPLPQSKTPPPNHRATRPPGELVKRTQASFNRASPLTAASDNLEGTSWIQNAPTGCQVPFYQLRINRQDLQEIESFPRSDQRHPAMFFAEGAAYEDVEVRARGDWARTWPKKSLKIFFDKAKPFQKQHVLNLNSAWRDPAFVREPLAYHVYEACGALSLQCRMVRLHVNGEFRGLYVEVEQPDKPFLSRNKLYGASIYKAASSSRSSDERNLGRPEAYAAHYEKETRKTEGFDELYQFCRDLEQTTNVVDFFAHRVDVGKYINYLAATVLVQNWDSPNKNHFLVCDRLESQKWLVIPWDLDRTFGDHWRHYFTETQLPIFLGTRLAPSTTGWNRMADKFLSEPALRTRFLARLAQLLETEFTPEKLNPVLDRWEKEISREGALDRQRWGGGDNEELHSGILQLKLYIKQRRAYLQTEVVNLRRRVPDSRE